MASASIDEMKERKLDKLAGLKEKVHEFYGYIEKDKQQVHVDSIQHLQKLKEVEFRVAQRFKVEQRELELTDQRLKDYAA